MVTSLCDRVLWLDRGAVRAAGPARDVCRRYEAALSLESTEQNEGFRIGGRGWRETPSGEAPAQAPRADMRVPADFDADAPLDAAGGAVIDRIGVFSSGTPRRVLSGGEDVELRIECHAERPLARPTVGFMLRDRLGQGVFGDHTYAAGGTAPAALEAGQGFSASFRFRFPYLLSGEYAMEAAVYEGTPTHNRMLARLHDAAFLSMQSRDPGGGLVNISASSIRLSVEGEEPVPSLAAGMPGKQIARQP
jgi:lipopolysaccharide transport system ATP-binding protein